MRFIAKMGKRTPGNALFTSAARSLALRSFVWGLFALGLMAPSLAASPSSSTVAVVPSFLGNGGAGFLNPADYPAFTFSEVSPVSVGTAADLAGYDTVILWQFCTVANYPAFAAALAEWVRAGGKLLLWDSDTCSGSAAVNYSWLASLGAEFTVSTAGGNGIRAGSLTIVQENRLSSAAPASPYFIDTAALVSAVDAAGDANVMTGWSSVWCADIEGRNARCDAAPGALGRVHAYTEPGKLTGSPSGWIVYCGLDYTGAGSGQPSPGREALVRLLRLELQHGWGSRGPENDDLCGAPVAMPTLIGINDVGDTKCVDQLIRFNDTSTGVGALVGSLGGSYKSVEALAVDPATQRVYAVDHSRLLLVNPTTGSGATIGNLSFSDVDGIAFHPQSGVLYGVTYSSCKLIRINPATGASTLVAGSFLAGNRLEDMAFHPDGRCFVLTNRSKIYQVNVLTGAKIKSWSLSGAKTDLEALTWSPDGSTLYSAADRGRYKDLVRITLGNTTATSQFVHPTLHSGFEDVEGLAFVTASKAVIVENSRFPGEASKGASGWMISQNFPNPFNPTTTVRVTAPSVGEARVAVYDVSGRLVSTLYSGTLGVGPHDFRWDGRDALGRRVGSGIYFCRLQLAREQHAIRMLLTK